MAKIKAQRALAAATLATLAVLSVGTPSRHAHWLTERSLAAHDHLQIPEAVSQERCGERVHLHAAFAEWHDACLACLRASQRARSPASSPVAGTSPVPDPAGLELPERGLSRPPPTGLPEGRAPPLT